MIGAFIGGATALFFTQGLLAVGNTIVTSLVSGKEITVYDIASSFVVAGIFGFLGGKVGIARISSIEKSMIKTLTSKFNKGGFKAVAAAFEDKTRKYIEVFLKTTLMAGLRDFFVESLVELPRFFVGTIIK